MEHSKRIYIKNRLQQAFILCRIVLHLIGIKYLQFTVYGSHKSCRDNNLLKKKTVYFFS